MRAKQDDERKRLLAARDSLRSAMGIGVLKLQGPTHLDPQACTGLTEKTGYLGKRPENALRITRRPWPKRFCTASMQGFTLAHSHVSQQPPSHIHTTLYTQLGETALHCAVDKEHEDIVELLLEAHADPDLPKKVIHTYHY